MSRAVCYQCLKPQQVCICPLCERVPNQTRILILQHGREKRHPIGTARIALLTLTGVQRLVAWKTVEKPDLSAGCALLYPGPCSRPLAALEPNERPDQLLVLDGTWSHAQVLYRNNPWLQNLPQVSLAPDAPSRYRIRAEPGPQCISTIESIVQALQILEPQTPGLTMPLGVFDRMIEDQIALQQKHARPRVQLPGSC